MSENDTMTATFSNIHAANDCKLGYGKMLSTVRGTPTRFSSKYNDDDDGDAIITYLIIIIIIITRRL